jgi:peptide/nickel transport system substrate-binding protein
MNRKDSFFVLILVVALAAITVVVGAPALSPVAAVPTDAPFVEAEARPYREGVLGTATSVSPLTARTQADRDLVALVFSGLVRNGPNGTLVPDLAARWSIADDARTWTFDLRTDARWHDGEPVVAEDVAFTIRTLQDPDYLGPSASSWTGVTARATGLHTVTFTLDSPVGGFLQALTQPIAPSHLLSDVPVANLPDDPFGEAPVGNGPFALVGLEPDLAVLAPPASIELTEDVPSADPSAVPTDSLRTTRPIARPDVPRPYLDGIEFHFYQDPERLAEDFRAGALDGVSGVDPTVAADLAGEPGSHLLRYPGSTLTAVIFNVRGGHPEFTTPAVRTALLAAIDREALVAAAFAGAAVQSDSVIPPSSPLYDPTVKTAVAHDAEAAAKALTKAGWKKANGRWRLPGAKAAFEFELLSPDRASNPAAWAAAESVTADWLTFGLGVKHIALPPGEFVSERLATGEFRAAVVDLAIGLDPDLYPLLASTQTLTGGSNVSGVQDATLDDLLEAARRPGTDEQRRRAYSALQARLATGRYLLPLAFQDESVVIHETVSGPVTRQVSDPSDRFWDVLTWRLADDR